MKKYITTLSIASLMLLGAGNVAIATFIDFTSTTWSGIAGNTSFSQAGVNFSTNSGLLTFNDVAGGDHSPGLVDPASIIPLAGIGDGIGIGDDEISGGESLTITFDKPVTGTKLYLLDSYANSAEDEGAEISFNGGSSWQTVYSQHLPWGFAAIDISSYGLFSSIIFRTIADAGISDFSVAGLDINPVPEPATMLLFGAGLAGLAGFQSRRKKE